MRTQRDVSWRHFLISETNFFTKLAHNFDKFRLPIISGVARAWKLGGKVHEVQPWSRNKGTYQNMCVGVIASAKGEKLRLPKARSPSRLGGLGERRKLP